MKKPTRNSIMLDFMRKHENAKKVAYKNKAIGTLLKLKYVELEKVDLGRIEDYIADILGFDREWREIKKDYKEEFADETDSDREILAQEEQVRRGYGVSYSERKQLTKIK